MSKKKSSSHDIDESLDNNNDELHGLSKHDLIELLNDAIEEEYTCKGRKPSKTMQLLFALLSK